MYDDYFVMVACGRMLLLSRMNYRLCSIHNTQDVFETFDVDKCMQEVHVAPE